MNELLPVLAVALCAYLVGGIPFGYLIVGGADLIGPYGDQPAAGQFGR